MSTSAAFPAHDGAARLRVEGLHKRRQGDGQVADIRVPALRLAPGRLVMVLGPNGSGKSTLFDMLALILSPDGVDRFELHDGERPLDLYGLTRDRAAAIRRHFFSYVLQTGGLLDFLTLGENIRFAARLCGRKARRGDEVAENLGIGAILGKHPARVSGGQRRRAALARALVQAPPILLADEPTADLDPAGTRTVMDAFLALARDQGTSVLMVTHDEALARVYAEEIYRFSTLSGSDGVMTSTLGREA